MWNLAGVCLPVCALFSNSLWAGCSPASFLQTKMALFRQIITEKEPPVEVPMNYSQSPPLVEKEWLTAEENSSGGPARNLDVRSAQRIGIRPMKPSIRSPLSSGLKDDHVASDRPSIGRRIFRTLTRFFI